METTRAGRAWKAFAVIAGTGHIRATYGWRGISGRERVRVVGLVLALAAMLAGAVANDAGWGLGIAGLTQLGAMLLAAGSVALIVYAARSAVRLAAPGTMWTPGMNRGKSLQEKPYVGTVPESGYVWSPESAKQQSSTRASAAPYQAGPKRCWAVIRSPALSATAARVAGSIQVHANCSPARSP